MNKGTDEPEPGENPGLCLSNRDVNEGACRMAATGASALGRRSLGVRQKSRARTKSVDESGPRKSSEIMTKLLRPFGVPGSVYAF